MRPSARLFLSLLLPFAPLAAQEKLTLRYAFQPGQVTWTQMTQQMTQSMTMAGRDMVTNLTQDTWMESKVTEVKDGVATIENRYARITIKGDGQMKVDYDSDVEGSKPGVMKDVAKLVGKTAKLRVDAMGKVLECTLPDGLEDPLEKSGTSMKQGFEQQFVSWPKDPVAVGETWQSNLEFPMGPMGAMKATITNKLVAMKDGVATVEVAMAMDTSGVKMPGGVKFDITVPKAGGVSKVALASAMPLDGTLAIEMKMDGGKDAPMSMKMTQNQAMKQVPAPAPKKPAETPKDEPKKDEKKD
jgi:hypothetical protein